MKKLLGGGMLIFTGAFMLLGFTINLSEKGVQRILEICWQSFCSLLLPIFLTIP